MKLCHKTWTVDVETSDNSQFEITKYEKSWKCTRHYTDTGTSRKLCKESFDLTECLKFVGFPMTMDNLSMLAHIIGIQLYSVTAHEEFRSYIGEGNTYIQYLSVGKIFQYENQTKVMMNRPSTIKFIKDMDTHIGYINGRDDSKVSDFAKLAVKRFYKLTQNSIIINDHHCYIFIDYTDDPSPDRVQLDDNYSMSDYMNTQSSSDVDTSST